MSGQRNLCFGLTADERASPALLVKFAAGVPPLGKCRSPAELDSLKLERAAFQKVTNTLWRNPTFCSKASVWLDNAVAESYALKPASGPEYFDKTPTLKCLDVTWASSWLLKHTKFLPNDLVNLDDRDPEALSQLKEGILNASHSLTLPP